MILKNCEQNQLHELVRDKKLILWGAGGAMRKYFSTVENEDLLKRIAYIVDWNSTGTFSCFETNIPIYKPERLATETDCILLVSSTKYIIEIYEELDRMSLPDSVECYFLSFINLLQPIELLEEGKRALESVGAQQAPRIIHTFWFSGEPLPREYQKCLDSWKKWCPDYEIKIWNQDTYDCKKNKFAYEAIQARKWAFAADFARLDVLYEYGGIYMDLDVEIFRPLDALLCHKGVFSHYRDNIDLPVFSSVKGNPLLKKLLDSYMDAKFSKDEDVQKNSLIQPKFVKPVFEQEGVPMEEGVHIVNGNLFLPRNMFLPDYWFDWSPKEDDADVYYGFHHCNAGWYSDQSRAERTIYLKKMEKLWKSIH